MASRRHVHAEYGEAPAALVQLHAGVTLDRQQIADHLRARLAAFKIPRLIEIRSDLPRDDAGKIRKRLLRDEYWREAGRKI